MNNTPPLPQPASGRVSHPAWKLWANPLLRRYARSRLRPQGLGVGLILTLVVAAFLFFVQRSLALYRTGLSPVDAERVPLVGLLILQAVILFVLGTGQVAGGMTGEKDEGVIDYQRLIPLSPLAKVLGYLFGLPIREYVMFLVTMPFTLWALWQGEVAAGTWLPIYAVLLSSTILYHLTGLVAGTVIKNRRWAFLAAIFAVFLLYTVIPQLAKFGLTTFKYLTLWPVVDENIAGLLPSKTGYYVSRLQQLAPNVSFFNLKFSETVFSLFSQAGLILSFIIMLWRRWRISESHLLGKIWAGALFAWIQLMLLGNALPLIDSGIVFPSVGARRYFTAMGGSYAPRLEEAVIMIGIYGLATLLMLLVLGRIITPSRDAQARGQRRMRKLALPRLPWHSDEATSFWLVLVMALCGAVGWMIFAHEIAGSHWFGMEISMPRAFGVFFLVLAASGLAFQAMLEAWGGRQVFFASVFIGVVPALTGTILAAASNDLTTAAIWLGGISPAVAPLYASLILIPSAGADLPLSVAMAIPGAFWFCQGLTALAMFWMVAQLVAKKKKRREMEATEIPN